MPRLVSWTPPTVPFRAEHVPVDREYLRRAVNRGLVHRLAPGVFIGAQGLSDETVAHHLQRALAQQMRFPTQIVASHETAAAALDLPLMYSGRLPDQPRFIRDPSHGQHRHSRPRVRVVPLPKGQVVTVQSGPHEGLRVTSPERTALDLAAESTLPYALMVLDEVARRWALARVGPKDLRGKVDERILHGSLAGLRRVNEGLSRRGARRRRLALRLADPRHESPAESASAGSIHLAGLPPPELQVRFVTRVGEYFTDFYWKKCGVVGECDGAVKYLGGDSDEGHAAADRRRVGEKRRALALEREHNLVVVPWFGYEAMYRPEEFLHPLADALRGRGCSW